MHNCMEVKFLARARNEAFARVAVAAFAVQLNPTLPEMADIKTAVSEAVTNAIVHGYRGREDGMVTLKAEYGSDRMLSVTVSDSGCGIEDVATAMQPFYSTGCGGGFHTRRGYHGAASQAHHGRGGAAQGADAG